jgi:hypothetical protein
MIRVTDATGRTFDLGAYATPEVETTIAMSLTDSDIDFLTKLIDMELDPHGLFAMIVSEYNAVTGE